MFCSAEGDSSYHDMAVELIWLMSHNRNVDLREKNTTGAWENAYYMLKGNTTMAIVQDDIFTYLVNNSDMYDSMMAASMKKIVPLHYEYVHLLVPDAGVITAVSDFNGVDINVGPKTSGTFITAMEIIKSYNFDEDDEITFHFDALSDAVQKVSLGIYDAMFVVSGVPYSRLYSYDTYVLPANCHLITPEFNPSIYTAPPSPYNEGILTGGGTPQYENYPYADVLLNPDCSTIRVRAVLVASPCMTIRT
jgi:TRAP-type uncharacterized transport system substrate-binding protein